MKNLFLIGGTMGVGKTTVSKILQKNLSKAVFLDGDWCWDADPFVVTDETKKMVINNISFLLNSFISCSEYENIIFCWVMHEESIINSIINSISLDDINLYTVSLMADKETIIARLNKDIQNGIRKSDVIERSIERIENFEKLSTIKIDTVNKIPEKIANELEALCR